MPIVSTSNVLYQKELCLIERIRVEQNFAQQTYVAFRDKKFGISPCCFSDYESAVMAKALSDWKYSVTGKTVLSSDSPGIFIQPLMLVNQIASISCPVIPTNVCTIIDLEELICKTGTFVFTQSSPVSVWTITHNLGRFPSVTVVDSLNQVVVGDVAYTNSNILTITFQEAFAGYAYLN